MQTDDVQAQYELLEQIAERLGRQKDSIKRTITLLRRRQARLTDSSGGQGASAFQAEMEGTLVPGLNRLVAALAAAQTTVRKASTTMEQAEREAAALFRAAPVATILASGQEGAVAPGVTFASAGNSSGLHAFKGSDRDFEKFQRGRWVSPRDGIGFKFGEARPAPGELARILGGLPEEKRAALSDPETEVTFYVNASRPGSEAFNQGLTERRGAEVERQMRALGIKAKIRVVAQGESLAREEDRLPMSVREPSDRDPADREDDPWHRTARIEVRPPNEKAGVDPKTFDRRDIKKDIANGKVLAEKALEPLGEIVREKLPHPGENKILPQPHRDPGRAFEQGKQVLQDAQELRDPRNIKKGPKKWFGKLADLGKGVAFELTGAKDALNEEVIQKRDPYYRAIAEGTASGLDGEYKSRWKAENADQQKLYETARRHVQGLSASEKLQLGAYLTLYATQHEETVDYLAPRMDGYFYQIGVEKYFSSDKYFHTN